VAFGSRVLGAAPTAQSSVHAKVGGTNAQVAVLGTWPAYETVHNSPVGSGRYFTQAELTGRRQRPFRPEAAAGQRQFHGGGRAARQG
jgi:putative ABC transport system permease protein